MDLLHDVLGGQAGVLDVGHLVAAAVFHLFVGDEVVALGEVEELGAGEGVGDGDLDGLAVELLGEVDGVADGFLGLAGEAEDEVAVDDEAEVVAVLDEVACALDGGALLDVLEDLRVAGLEADDEQAAAGFLHGLEGVAVGGDARGAGPGDAEGLELCAELDGAGLLDVEGVVVEEELLDVGEVFFGPASSRRQRRRWSACARRGRRASAARGRRCTARGSRGWSRARCTGAGGTARCTW